MSEFITHSREETVALGAQVAAASCARGAHRLYRRAWRGQDGLLRGHCQRSRLHRPGQQPDLRHRELLPRAAAFAHFDLYRISTENDLCAAGFYDYLDEGAVVAAEWSENFADLLALEDPIHINIERVDDTTRRITIEGVEV